MFTRNQQIVLGCVLFAAAFAALPAKPASADEIRARVAPAIYRTGDSDEGATTQLVRWGYGYGWRGGYYYRPYSYYYRPYYYQPYYPPYYSGGWGYRPYYGAYYGGVPYGAYYGYGMYPGYGYGYGYPAYGYGVGIGVW